MKVLHAVHPLNISTVCMPCGSLSEAKSNLCLKMNLTACDVHDEYVFRVIDPAGDARAEISA